MKNNILINKNIKSNKFNTLCLILFAAILCFNLISSFCINVDANNSNNVEWDYNNQPELDGAMKNLAWKMAKTIYGESTMSDIINDVDFSFDGSSSNTNSTALASRDIWSFIESTYKLMQPVGVGLVLMYFLLDIVEKATHEQMSLEHFLRSTIKFIVAIVFIFNGLELLRYGIEFTTALGKSIFGSSDTKTLANAEKLKEIYETLRDANILDGFFTPISYVLQFILPYVVMFGCTLVTKFVVWGRLIEIGVRGAFAPVGMADLFSEGTKGSGYRYFKKFVALALQGAVIIGIMMAYSTIQLTLTKNSGGFDDTMGQVVTSLTVITLIMKSQTIANDLVGV